VEASKRGKGGNELLESRYSFLLSRRQVGGLPSTRRVIRSNRFGLTEEGRGEGNTWGFLQRSSTPDTVFMNGASAGLGFVPGLILCLFLDHDKNKIKKTKGRIPAPPGDRKISEHHLPHDPKLADD
jgi:hypothetical protein